MTVNLAAPWRPEPATWHRNCTGTCARCGEEREIHGRRLCQHCWRRIRGTDEVFDYPRVNVRVVEILEEWQHPAWAGRSFVEVAATFGLKPATAQRAWYRACERGLVTA